MKLTLSFAFAAIALLQVTAAVPVVDKRVVKPSAGLVAEGSPDVEGNSSAPASFFAWKIHLVDNIDVEKRVVKPFAARAKIPSEEWGTLEEWVADPPASILSALQILHALSSL
ncbi:uncharacterized protein EDB91DRAFT_1348313 [Suillus paluster]|uniref:uncharacterized protein n=1 Tax=Suillus paluster TaxID=48578 RepID=UPI001B862EB8|nr:uncharacterized protein EDB91DRAFT_1348313 [Suillus paluster]KAG1735294.1 hypothetical protein EDB91DRAFT_1348313 [Suillus paluster]